MHLTSHFAWRCQEKSPRRATVSRVTWVNRFLFFDDFKRSQSIFLISMHFVQTLALQLWRTISSATSQYVFLFGRTSGFCFGKESSEILMEVVGIGT